MVHLKPLGGYPGHESRAAVLEAAAYDAAELVAGGIDGIIVENNYDLPHHIQVSDDTRQMMREAVWTVREIAAIPLGVCVLWNGYASSLDIAASAKAQFIRVPVFVDEVEASCGRVKGDPEGVMKARRRYEISGPKLLTDIHVKHSKLLSPYTIEESAAAAVRCGSDGLIITGKWTGDAPSTEDLSKVRRTVPDAPIIVGSGCTAQNALELFSLADAVIVGTALKEGEIEDPDKEVNLKSHNRRISRQLVRELIGAVR